MCVLYMYINCVLANTCVVMFYFCMFDDGSYYGKDVNINFAIMKGCYGCQLYICYCHYALFTMKSVIMIILLLYTSLRSLS